MLSDKYTVDDIRNSLIAREEWHPFPTRDEREGWEGLDEETRQGLIANGEAYLGHEWTVFRATQFMEMARTGLRSLYGSLRQPHRNALTALVLAECVEGKGRFLDDIVDGIWALCEESWWGKPWHLSRQKVGANLSNIDDPHIDLFVAETASLLSWTCYLLEPQINDWSAMIMPRVDHEMQERMLTPLLEREDYHWMGFKGRAGRGLHRVNNWNPWIISNWVTSVLLMERDPERRVAGLHKTMRALDNFIDPYPKDGGCDEGPGYWGRAGASMFECLESYYGATNQKVDVYGDQLIKNIGTFITKVQVFENWFVNFADASALVNPSPFLVHQYGKRIGDKDLMSAGAYYALRGRDRDGNGGSIARQLPALFHGSEVEATEPRQPLPGYAWLPEIQVMTARDKAGSGDGLYVAMKGGHNSESHNHNDVGHFIVYTDGEPVIIDAGVEAYTGKTFSSERYDIWTMQSAYHSLPTINGVMQDPGIEFAAKDASSENDTEKASIALDIADAYPPEANLKTWRRNLTLTRGQEIHVVDQYELTEAANTIQLSLLTPCTVEVSEGKITLGKRDLSEGRSAGEVCIHFDDKQMTVAVERKDLTDGKSLRYWGEYVSRILFTLVDPGSAGMVELRFSR
jgi:hypothetical protein